MINGSGTIRRAFINKEVTTIFLFLTGTTLVYEFNIPSKEIINVLWSLILPEYISAIFIAVLGNVFSGVADGLTFWVLTVLFIYFQAVVLVGFYVIARYTLVHLHWSGEPAS